MKTMSDFFGHNKNLESRNKKGKLLDSSLTD